MRDEKEIDGNIATGFDKGKSFSTRFANRKDEGDR